MLQISSLDPVDYLIIGHLTVDQTAEGPRLGGTASYAARTAHALGLRVGVATAWGGELPLDVLHGIAVASIPAVQSTTFENIYTAEGRIQFVRCVAPALEYEQIPLPWRAAPIVHLAPVAQEVGPQLAQCFPNALVGVTPQGWLRAWDGDGRVHSTNWADAPFVLPRAGAAVLSIEDVQGDEERIEEMTTLARVLAVTEAERGARLYWNGDVRRFRAAEVDAVDATGAGDVFAAAFFARLHATRDPWEAARFATRLATISVTRPGLGGIPAPDEIRACLVEVL